MRDPLGAVAACTRALAQADVAVTPPAGRRDLSLLRAVGDRIAVRQRFHDKACHRAHRPQPQTAAAVFDALEDARLDAVGTRWMPGVAANLSAHAGVRATPVRWLAFEAFTDRSSPPDVADAAAPLRRALTPELAAALAGLQPLIDRQADFAAASAEWARAAAALPGMIRWPDARIDDSTSAVVAEPRDPTVLASDERAIDDRSALPADRPSPEAAFGAPEAAAAPGGDADYTAFTTAHDRVVDAAATVDASELAQLRARLDRELGVTRQAATRLAHRVRRALLARQTRRWRFDLDEGWIDGRRLSEVIAGSRAVSPFRQESESPFPSAAVTLLIDLSGSMRGRPILMAALTVELMVQALERCGVACEVLGFTTRSWRGGRPADEWSARGRPARPGRLAALEHVVLKAADTPWRRARNGLAIVLREDQLKENIDGEAVLWAHERLRRRAEVRRLLVVVSDGAPRDEATDEANDDRYLARHLQRVVADIEARSPVTLMAIGIGHDVWRFYTNAETISRTEDLSAALGTALLTTLMPSGPAATPSPRGRRWSRHRQSRAGDRDASPG